MPPASVRLLTASTGSEIEALAEIFDQYRAHYGEASDAVSSGRWLEECRAPIACARSSPKTVARSSALRPRWRFPASLRLGHLWQIRDLFVLPTDRRLGIARTLLTSVREAAIASDALRLVLRTEQDNEPALRLYRDSGYTPIDGYVSLMLPLDTTTSGRSN